MINIDLFGDDHLTIEQTSIVTLTTEVSGSTFNVPVEMKFDFANVPEHLHGEVLQIIQMQYKGTTIYGL